jgi:alpha-tubulin suppressor-like RCC1 family protein
MTSGGVRCWGNNNYYGALGDGTTTDRLTPPTYDVLTDAQAIACSGSTTYALLNNGTVASWGDNESGELGIGTLTYGVKTPTLIPGLSGVKAISAGGPCVLMTTGGVRCWGSNLFEKLGIGMTKWFLTPKPVNGICP